MLAPPPSRQWRVQSGARRGAWLRVLDFASRCTRDQRRTRDLYFPLGWVTSSCPATAEVERSGAGPEDARKTVRRKRDVQEGKHTSVRMMRTKRACSLAPSCTNVVSLFSSPFSAVIGVPAPHHLTTWLHIMGGPTPRI